LASSVPAISVVSVIIGGELLNKKLVSVLRLLSYEVFCPSSSEGPEESISASETFLE
jgi:hypothetical protein